MPVSSDMSELKRDYPLNSLVSEYVHADDGGALYVSSYGTIHSVYVVVMRCAICGHEYDVSDGEALATNTAHPLPAPTVDTEPRVINYNRLLIALSVVSGRVKELDWSQVKRLRLDVPLFMGNMEVDDEIRLAAELIVYDALRDTLDYDD